MIDRRSIAEIPIVGTLVAGGLDLVLYGGDLLGAVVIGILTSIDIWVPMLSYLSRVTDAVPWLESSTINGLLVVGAVGLVALYGVRLGRRLLSTIREASNQ